MTQYEIELSRGGRALFFEVLQAQTELQIKWIVVCGTG